MTARGGRPGGIDLDNIRERGALRGSRHPASDARIRSAPGGGGVLLSEKLASEGRVRVYRGAAVFDGTGAPRFTADVAIEGARIVGIRRQGDPDDLTLPAGAVEVDATGLALAPGFVAAAPDAQPTVTTALTAPDGNGPAAVANVFRADSAETRTPSGRPRTLEEAVRMLTSAPAERLGLDLGDAPRGVLREGAIADLLLFDPSVVDAGALLAVHPHEVLVAGIAVVADGAPTGAEPGRMLTAQPPAHLATVPWIEHDIDPEAEPFELRANTPVIAADGLAGIAAQLRGWLGVSIHSVGQPAITLGLDRSLDGAEAFRITVTAAGVEITGATPEGVFRGAVTLRQLCTSENAIGSVISAGTWSGEPAFGWRGVMLDVARHFRPADDVRRLIDLLAAHHLNVLHLHLTDDQGWRFEVPGYPRLTEIGAVRTATQLGHGPDATVQPGRHEGFYSASDLRDLVAYAAERFVTLVPEVELPGHVQAALAAYPDLGNTDVSEPAVGPWDRFGINHRTLAPTDAALTFGFAAIDALCDAFDSEWIGIGGDEVSIKEWATSAAAQDRMLQLGLTSARDVQPWFTRAFVAHVRSRGRTALAWDEVLEGEVPEGVRLLAWRGPVAMAEALRRGIPVIACPDLEAYLDYPQADSVDEPIRVGPPLPLERAYTLRVPDGAVGGQANVWTEHLPTRDRVDFAMFPRLAAIAERLWLGGEPAPFDDFAGRLPVHLRRLAAAGVQYRPLDGPRPDQRRPGVPGKHLTLAQRTAIVDELVAGLRG
ncbi:beta-N-acetylhexosaminidase [Microbacterium sp. H1-D42]|uniref:beta-N-acetylhexosaminidase n=1 Tax=Microbacterium sp. H1-D42 TaxID=2925844 RepID=UPI001F53C987|nr:beta-N-acetylhexosaminidase [Microbacterium sp. H1-D42]UNK70856.1 family 20 glycosylhydrolase [Microbacterium sp. H1-D42]